MLKIEKFVTPSPEQWEIVIEGARNPMNSWDRMDSYATYIEDPETLNTSPYEYFVGPNDEKLMTDLTKGGSDHAKFRRMLPVHVTLSAPLYWWKQFDTYKIGTVSNSCSTMHKIQSKEFEFGDFSTENLTELAKLALAELVSQLEMDRRCYLTAKADDNKQRAREHWDNMIQLLPTSYNQKRTVALNYEVLHPIYRQRRHHKLGEWHVFCDWIRSLPYSELITGEVE